MAKHSKEAIRRIMKIPSKWTWFDELFLWAYTAFLVVTLTGLLGTAAYAIVRLVTHG